VKYSANGFVPQSQGRYSRRVSSPIDSMSEAELKGKILTSAIEHASLENLDVALQKNLRKGASLLEPRWRRYHPASGRIRHLIQTLFRSYTSLSLLRPAVFSFLFKRTSQRGLSSSSNNFYTAMRSRARQVERAVPDRLASVRIAGDRESDLT
jgi:hypothetical protein